MANTFFANVSALKYDAPFTAFTNFFGSTSKTVPVGKYAVISQIKVGSSADTVTITKDGFIRIFNTPGDYEFPGGLFLPEGTIVSIPSFTASPAGFLGAQFSNT